MKCLIQQHLSSQIFKSFNINNSLRSCLVTCITQDDDVKEGSWRRQGDKTFTWITRRCNKGDRTNVSKVIRQGEKLSH